MNIPTKNPQRIVSEFQLKRNVSKTRSILLVEGLGDEEFFKKILSNRECRFIICDGKANVRDSIRTLTQRNQKGVLGIVDTDYDELLGRQSILDNLFYTDSHDVETTILSSLTSLSNFIDVYADLDSYEEFLIRTDELYELTLYSAAKRIGILRLVSLEQGYDFSFKELIFDEFVDNELSIDISKLCEALIRSSSIYIDKNRLIELYENKLMSDFDLFCICHGHDITKLIEFSLREIFGSAKGQRITQAKIEEIFRIIYNPEVFGETNLFKKLSAWEEKNKPFVLFEETDKSFSLIKN
jgi:hypothetical protein